MSNDKRLPMDSCDLAPPDLRQPARRRALRMAGLALVAVASGAVPGFARAQQTPRRVLIIHSFGRDFAPFDAAIATFRRELASSSPQPVVFVEAALDAGRPIGPDEEAAFVAYLQARFSQPAPNLVVSSGGPAARFLIRHREELFAGLPILLAAFEARVVPRAALKPGDAMVASQLDLPRAFETILRVLPDTRTIAVVVGDTPLERYWRTQLERDGASLAGRVRFVWFDGLSLPQMRQRIAALPPDSAVFYALLLVDAAGVPHERLEALGQLMRSAQVPIFGLYENELGQGVVGGPYNSQTRVGREAARVALRRLGAAVPTPPEFVTVSMEDPVYDARQLQRWGIRESRLPPGSEVRFREPSPWDRYRSQIVGTALVIGAQAALIAALLVQRRRRHRAEQEARTLGGRLITAYEDEGRRLARELHDDITQRLAGVSIEAATLGRIGDPAARQAAEQTIGSELAALSRDVHALSYRLHPSVIDDLGLGEALRIECERAARRGAIEVDFTADEAGHTMRGDHALCLFRVAQEALRNALRHSQAQHVRVELRAAEGGTSVSVSDDGIGFDPVVARDHASLGLASMRERVALIGGRLDLRSRQGQGTSVTAWVPAAEATS
jgi:signal transduction histidine kinase